MVNIPKVVGTLGYQISLRESNGIRL
jgi:hypothetical protein